MEYNFAEIEQRAKDKWTNEQVYKVNNPTVNDTAKPKCYILDMFPYPSGAGLHVGHPLGYIASDIYARYKRLNGYNVLHPMGFDAFGLPAEQYALETGQHPVETTRKNIARYREQLDNIGFCYDWSREVRTSDAKYYKWTQWIFLQLFHSWFDRSRNKVRPIEELINIFENEGNINNACPGDENIIFDATGWNDYTEQQKRDCLMQYRMAYQGYAQVWWCEALGTVLANDEVVNGVSERGNHPVERKNMRQWFLRITEYAERLLSSLDKLEWSEAMKEMQRNWIGKSIGAEVKFRCLTPALSEGEGDGESTGLDYPGWQTAEKTLYDNIAPFQRELKNNLTEAEDAVWQRLRNNNVGAKFRRQHVIGRFIADFVCLPNKLVVEIDGGIHEQQKEDDAIRTAYLNEKGFRVIRFSNEEVFQNIDAVINKIKEELTTNAPTQLNITSQNNTSLSLGEGRGEANHDITNQKNTQKNHNNTSLSFGEGRGEATHNEATQSTITVFTTRPDTIFGVDFMVLAPEHELVDTITTAEQKTAIDEYKTYVKSRSERERMSEVKQITGCFTGAYAVHPFTGNPIPVWIAEYVLAGYGTGAIMGVPSGDDRDFAFANHFGIPITNIFGDNYTGEKAYSDKTGTIENSGFVSGCGITEAAGMIIDALAVDGRGKKKVNYKLRDAGFSRQRYWGEPFPIVYVNDIPYGIDEEPVSETDLNSLPVELPYVEGYKPGPEGQGPLANITDWMNTPTGQRETNTMPGYAGSSWYFLRYMDPHNDTEFADRKVTDYWNQVDLYIGGTEHAVGHLLYSRMWTKALYDLNHISFDEPFKRLLNQGMIQGQSFFCRQIGAKATTLNANLKYFLYSYGNTASDVSTFEKNGVIYQTQVTNDGKRILNGHSVIDTKNRLTKSAYATLLNKEGHDEKTVQYLLDNVFWEETLTENGEQYIQCKMEVEKMSKSKYNVVNPDDIVAQYGADTFRMYEMFLGPIDVSKPWDTKGIEGVHRFLKKMWRLYFGDAGWIVTDDAPTDEEYRTLHKTIKKIGDDIERFSFNTSVSQFMICVNELSALGCHKRAILEPLAVVICPFAPHIAEELWQHFGHTGSVVDAAFPKYEDRYVTDNTKKYPVAVNGKTRIELEFALDADPAEIEKAVLAEEVIQKWMEGKPVKKFIYVRGKMINVVV